MTKITILGANTQKKKELKKIKFVYCIDVYLNKSTPKSKPNDWANIILISKGYSESGLDLMYAYDDIGDGNLYFGHFNDGIV